jgi:asparagine synthase (glutamine-hydrolysing)
VNGFAGIVRMEPTVQSAEADRASSERLAQAIVFRGPDSQHQSQSGGASFAFSFARTGPAPQSNVQPVTLDGTVWLIGDVRLDRRKELIAGLIQQGERPGPSVTDEEVVLLTWKLWREAGVRRIFFDEIYGDFSFALWEPDRQELNCFRDVMGGRPFYYCAQERILSFSNTLGAIHHAPGFARELDREYISDFLLFSWCPRPQHTVYKSIRRLPAGHWLTFSTSGLQVRRFQGLPIEEPLFLQRSEEYLEIYRDLLGHAVKDRLPNAPAAIFLSGGMDSSTVAATVCSLRKKAGAENDLHAVSADLQPLFDDEEGQFAAKVAEHLGIGFELSHLGGYTPFSGFDQLDICLPEPLANPFREIYLHLYRKCAAKSRVVFLGYGGDDVLTGQTGPYFLYLARHGQFGRAFSSFAQYLIAKKKLPPLRVGIQSWIRKRLGSTGPQFPPWLAPSFEREFNLRGRWQELQRGEPALHPIHPIAYRALTGTFWPQALEREDPAYTGLPLEIRTPLFDYRLLRFLLRLPPLPWCVNKKIMRHAIQGALPEAVLRRAKAPLARDPLLLHAEQGAWRLVQQAAIPSPEIRDFVDWPEFVAYRNAVSEPALWTDVPPMALNFWLKGIEKGRATR